MKDLNHKNCPDCGVGVGMNHHNNCDVQRCSIQDATGFTAAIRHLHSCFDGVPNAMNFLYSFGIEPSFCYDEKEGAYLIGYSLPEEWQLGRRLEFNTAINRKISRDVQECDNCANRMYAQAICCHCDHCGKEFLVCNECVSTELCFCDCESVVNQTGPSNYKELRKNRKERADANKKY